jgi:hypothetical protein
MQICKNCGTENQVGELFCYRCGVALGALSISTSQLGEDEDILGAGSQYMSADHVIFLHFSGYSDPVGLQMDRDLVLGRESGEGRLNLELYEAISQGVSRQHATLIPHGNQIYLRDLKSTNHTYLNGEQLNPEREYVVRDGDEVMLGRLIFKVFFK